MEIILENIGRRFNQDWIFKGIDYQFIRNKSYAILGANGSGKSTLLQIIISSLSPSRGHIRYQNENKEIEVDHFFSYVSLAAPYVDLVEEFTLTELIDFHFSFKKLATGLDTQGVIDLLELQQAANKEIRYFSSGMKQRTKLALACCADTPTLFLDEPTSNLDTKGIAWYHQLVERFGANRLLVICSNQLHEYEFCNFHLQMETYK